jgi:hypothetical protein
MLPLFAAQRALKKCMGRAGPGEGPGGMGGPWQDGESQLLNLIVVEAMTGVCESKPENEFDLEFGIPLIK